MVVVPTMVMTSAWFDQESAQGDEENESTQKERKYRIDDGNPSHPDSDTAKDDKHACAGVDNDMELLPPMRFVFMFLVRVDVHEVHKKIRDKTNKAKHDHVLHLYFVWVCHSVRSFDDDDP